MDPARSALSGLVEELVSSERFRAFLEDFPVPARVSEPALALVLPAPHAALARSSACSPRTRRRATLPRRSRGTRIQCVSRYFRVAAFALARGSSRRRISSASVHARSPYSLTEASSAGLPARSRRACHPGMNDLTWSVSLSATSLASTASWRRLRWPVTSGVSGPRGEGRWPFGAGGGGAGRG